MIRVFGPKDGIPKGITFNVTSNSSEVWCRQLSPFFLGPVKRSDGRIAKNLENAWQFSKVYPQHVNENNLPTEEWWEWSSKGFNDTWAHRYPMGKGEKPLYSWDGSPLNYVQARKYLYTYWYVKAARQTEAYRRLKQMYDDKIGFYIFDYDGYDFKSLGMSYEDVLNNTERPMGHGIVLAAMLEDEPFDLWRIRRENDFQIEIN